MTANDFLDQPESSSDSLAMPVRLMSYGPIVNEYHHAAMFGPARNRLQPYDVAASPDTGLQQGNVIDIGDGRLRRVADWSFRREGVPTSHTIELRDKTDQGHGTVRK